MITFDPDSLTERIAELEEKMGQPGFWDEQQRAARISTEHSRLTKRLDRYTRLRGEYDDARELLEMDGELGAEIGEVTGAAAARARASPGGGALQRRVRRG